MCKTLVGILSSIVLALPAACGDARSDALDALRAANKDTMDTFNRDLPQFATWYSRGDLGLCGQNATHRILLPFLHQAQVADEQPHAHPAMKHAMAAQDSPHFGEEFLYDKQAFDRLCGKVTDASSKDLRAGSTVLSSWLAEHPTTSIMPLYDEGTRAATMGWQGVPRAGGLVGSLYRLPEHTKFPVAFTVSDAVRTAYPPTGCDPHAPQAAKKVLSHGDVPQEISIESFFFVELKPGEAYQGVGCGDFLVLTHFNLIQRKAASSGAATGWLWSAFWWDSSAPAPFKIIEPLDGPGFNRTAWKNYAMNAAYGPTEVIFNPARALEPTDSNCESCHNNARIPEIISPNSKAVPLLPPLPGLSLDFLFAPAEIGK